MRVMEWYRVNVVTSFGSVASLDSPEPGGAGRLLTPSRLLAASPAERQARPAPDERSIEVATPLLWRLPARYVLPDGPIRHNQNRHQNDDGAVVK
jgi:hypothetical protein